MIIFGLIVVMGMTSIYNVLIGDTVPPVLENSDGMFAEKAKVRTATHLYRKFNAEEAWNALQPALEILDELCPEASAWARNQHAKKHIVWIPDPDGTYARYDMFGGRLIINAEMYTLNDGEIACTIAHEFRHSRQNISKSIQSACAIILTGKQVKDIIEDDAYFYECKLRESIYGYR